MEGVATDEKEKYDDMISDVKNYDWDNNEDVVYADNGDNEDEEFGEMATNNSRARGGDSNSYKVVKDNIIGG